jgi:hypothetical protein
MMMGWDGLLNVCCCLQNKAHNLLLVLPEKVDYVSGSQYSMGV